MQDLCNTGASLNCHYISLHTLRFSTFYLIIRSNHCVDMKYNFCNRKLNGIRFDSDAFKLPPCTYTSLVTFHSTRKEFLCPHTHNFVTICLKCTLNLVCSKLLHYFAPACNTKCWKTYSNIIQFNVFRFCNIINCNWRWYVCYIAHNIICVPKNDLKWKCDACLFFLLAKVLISKQLMLTVLIRKKAAKYKSFFDNKVASLIADYSALFLK